MKYSDSWNIKTTLTPEKIKAQIEEKFINRKGITKDELKGKKGLVFQKRILYYRVTFSNLSFSLRAATPGTNKGIVFRAHGTIEPQGSENQVTVQIPFSWINLIFGIFWLLCSGIGFFWNIYLSAIGKSLKIEAGLCFLLVVIGIVIFRLLCRQRKREINKFKEELSQVLKQ